eukprot:GEMP01003048.1.p1 GENE.GEMP01003048.1~~GEMP01003048.1.p1  ORF type:complete len:1354 (+),score=364.56 GEMP01003048.1:31-4062(+)
MDASQYHALVAHYLRDGYYRKAQDLCSEAADLHADPFFNFWRAFGMFQEGLLREAIIEVEQVLVMRGMELPAAAALLFYYEKSDTVDEEGVLRMQQILSSSAVENAREEGILVSAMFFALVSEFKRAHDMLAKLGDSINRAKETTRGWVALLVGEKTATSSRTLGPILEKVIKHFQQAIDATEKTDGVDCLDALMGKAKALDAKRSCQPALDCINKVVVIYPWYLPGLLVKAKILMMMSDWDQTMDVCSRIALVDENHIDALRVQTLYYIVREAKMNVAAQRLESLFAVIQLKEPLNGDLMLSCVQLYSRSCGRNKLILDITTRMIQSVTERNMPPDLLAKYITELGYQYLFHGDHQKAADTFHSAATKDESDVRALYGLILCRIEEGHLDDAAEQLEFLQEIHVSVGKSAELTYLSSLISLRKRQAVEQALALLSETLTLHITSFKPAVGFDFFIRLNADFLFNVAQEYLRHYRMNLEKQNYLARAIQVLETLGRFVPGFLDAQVVLAESKVTMGDNDAALRILLECLRLDSQYSAAYVQLARIYLSQGQSSVAFQYLEQGSAQDFKLRSQPLYHLVRAKMLTTGGDIKGAEHVLEDSLALPGVKSIDAKGGKAVALADRSAIFIDLVSSYIKSDKLNQATILIQHAMKEFQKSTEEVKILCVNAELSVKKGEIDQALALLRSGARPEHPSFAAAKVAMANIYKNEKNDKKSYARCYKEIVDVAPTSENYLTLGNALFNIQEPQDAIKAYQTALETGSKSDPNLVRKIGQVLIQTHDYEQAIQYYLEAIRRDPGKLSVLRQDLAKLLWRLQRWEQAIQVLQEAYAEAEAMPVTVNGVKFQVELLMQLSKIHTDLADSRAAADGSGSVPQAAEFLKQARDLMNGVVQSFDRATDSQTYAELIEKTAELNIELGEYFEKRERNLDFAVSHYGEALRWRDTHEKAILSLARIHLQRGEIDACEKQLMTLLRVNSTNEEGSMMMAEVMMLLAAMGTRSEGGSQEYKFATYHYQVLLECKPCNYSALAKLIFLLKRSGRLFDAPKYLEAAEKACERCADQEPGLRYCQGVYARWLNHTQDSLVHLHFARRDPDFRAAALTHMIEIYLHPDPTAGIEGLDPSVEIALDRLSEVDDLINELAKYTQGWNPRLKVYQSQVLILSKKKPGVERGLALLMEIVNENKNYAPALLAMSEGLIVQKQTTKARNQLKRLADLAKKNYTPEFADTFERGWLLLADIYIQSAKYDLACALCHLAKDHNRSCGKAWEQLGLINEKEQAYKDAVTHYEKAWNFCDKGSPSVGYRLAFNYLKAKRLVEAINVTQQVLAISENYPKIRNDILDKARAALRT